jgi:hypothetical protein
MGQARFIIARAIPLTALFALVTYTALTIQPYVSDSPIFNKTLGLSSPLIIGDDNLYTNLTAIITNAVLIAITYLVLARSKPRIGSVRYSLGIVAVYAILSATLYLVITTKPTYACTSIPMNLDSMTIFMASMVIGLATPLVYTHERRWKIDGDWKPLLFTLYASIVVGSLIIDVATALALHSIPRLIPRACASSVTIGYYGPIDGLVIVPLLGLLAGYAVVSITADKQWPETPGLRF